MVVRSYKNISSWLKSGRLQNHRGNNRTMGSASTITPPIISSINHANPRRSSLRISVNRPFQLQLRVRLFSRERKSNLVARRINCSTVEVENGLEDETCELVNGKELSIGEVQAYLFQAVKNNNRIGILLLSDIFGFEDSATRDFAYRVACNGYNVLVPDLFQGDPWSKHRPKEDLERWIAEQDPERVARDVDTATKWMVEEFLEPKSETETKKKKLGVIGFCYGGGRVVEALGRDEEGVFGTGVSFYGTRIDLSSASKVKVPVLFVAGDGDPLCPVDLVEGLEKSVGRGSRSVVFKGRGHGFVHRPSSAEEDCDAEEAFLITRNWLQDRLAVLELNS